MDMKRREKQTSPPPPPSHPSDLEVADDGRPTPEAASPNERKSAVGSPKAAPPRLLLGVLLALVLLLPTFALLRGYRRIPATADSDDPVSSARKLRLVGSLFGREPSAERKEPKDSNDGNDAFVNVVKDKLLGGLLSSEFDEGSCLSRYQSVIFRKDSPYKPSPHLLERLRDYEHLHRKCGPSSELYNRSIDQLKSGQNDINTECKYVVWISYSGLGNRMLTLASSFLYALLTGRVLLVDRAGDMTDLFCEPFPHETWFLPLDFPLQPISNFDKNSPQSYGSMLENKTLGEAVSGDPTGPLPPYVYVHLGHDYSDPDKLFFCDQDQDTLNKFTWMVLRSDNYFVPSLFLMPAFEEELRHLFPEKDTVFHHLGRYLFHPTNIAWGLITRYYQAYLAKADERVGIQIRVFDIGTGPFQHVLDQILACSFQEKLLPEVDLKKNMSSNIIGKSKAVLLTSLNSGYSEKIRNIYWEHPASNGEIISVYQPSTEEYQQTEKHAHNMKALSEMYLLSLCDSLVTSAWSTFGYVAQSLGGLKPRIMFKPENKTAPDPPCRLAMSMEPCFHAPPFYDCKAKRGVDTGELVPHVRHCEDMSWGLKLVNRDEW